MKIYICIIWNIVIIKQASRYNANNLTSKMYVYNYEVYNHQNEMLYFSTLSVSFSMDTVDDTESY